MLRIRPLTHTFALALAIAVAATPAAHARLTDENSISEPRVSHQDLRSPDTRDAADGYTPAATSHVGPSDTAGTRPRSAPDGTPWMLIGFAVTGACAAVGVAKRTRRARIPV